MVMKAFTKSKYGGPEILQLEELDKPVPGANEILIKVVANSANPADWHILRGKPFFARFTSGLLKPKERIPGADFAGIVMEIGRSVTRFKPGDRVFGETLNGGAFAEYTAAPESVCALMPANVGFTEIACVPVAGLTALQALTTHGKLEAGQCVLINGSSGGVGHFAVQIAKAIGAKVVAVCSARNAEFVRTLGADQVISYDRENIYRHKGKYDLVIDTNGNLRHRDYKRMGRRGVSTGFTTMGHMISLSIAKGLSKYPLVQFTAAANQNDLEVLAGYIGNGQIKPHIEKIFPYEEIPNAIAHIESMRTRGKVAVVWE
jgi:NADPH:quinone reductase-like Zn-dependent oxidoreductase